MFMNKLKTKSNGVLNRMVSKTEEFTISLEEMSPAKATQMASNVEYVGKKT